MRLSKSKLWIPKPKSYGDISTPGWSRSAVEAYVKAELAAQTGAWTAVSFGTDWEQFPTFPECAARIEGQSVQLRGIVKCKTAYSAGGTVITLPIGHCPAERLNLMAGVGNTESTVGTSTLFPVATSGICVLEINIALTGYVILSGLIFPLN